jgi:iron complex outermembrane receptor protein
MISKRHPPNPRRVATLVVLSVLLPMASLRAQEPPETLHGNRIEGTVRDAEGQPLAGVLLRIAELQRIEYSHEDGRWHFERLPTGSYTLVAERIGYGSRTVPFSIDESGELEIDLVLTPSAIDVQGFVVTGTADARSGDRVLRPVDVLAGQELSTRLQGTVAATLSNEPGLAQVTMGPATARPVIRGLGGDRVLMLEDGQRVGDVSAVSTDHATALDPAGATRIEVVRGPSALLYGSQALGGVINVIREEVPRSVHHEPHGDLRLQTETVNNAWVGAGSLLYGVGEHIGLRFEGSRRSAGNLATPEGALDNTGLTTTNLGAATSWVGERGYAGAGYRYYANDYGIPGGFVGAHPEGVNVEMRRHALRGESEWRDLGPIDRLEVNGVHTRYDHRELEDGGIVGTEYGLFTSAGEVRARHGGLGPSTGGTVGMRLQRESFAFGGSLSTPNTRRWTGSVYAFEEMQMDRMSLEAGVRWDRVITDVLQPDPDSDIGNVRDRTFDALSGSVGLLFEAAPGLRVGVTAARAFRAPDVNELYSEGPHLASYIFEVGNPDLDVEVGTGLDAFVRLDRERIKAELAVFRNAISGYLYPRDTGELSRVQLPIFQFTGADALMLGFEGSASVAWTSRLASQATLSYVRGTIRESDEPLPLIPPLNGRVDLRWESPDWFSGAEVRWASSQNRLGAFETATDGYALIGFSAGWRAIWGGRLHTFTLRLDNLTDAVYRNHLSRTKELMPEAGRGLSFVYRVVY